MSISSNKYPLHWGLAGQTIPWVNRLYRKIKNSIYKHEIRGDSRKILLVAHNKMMLKKLSEIVDIFESESSIQWFCTICEPPDISKELIIEIDKYGYTFVHPYASSIQLWDLIIVASHSVTHNFNHSIPTLLIPHGIGDTKVILNTTERYQYAHNNVLNKKNKPVYTCIFESSERRKLEAIEDIPILKGHISVVGHIEVDKVLSLNNERMSLRRMFGYDDDDIVLLICSSHGDKSLLDSVGHALIAEALTLPEKYKLIIATHFLNWQKIESDGMSLGATTLKYESDRVKVLKPDDDYLKSAVAADICLSDFTSASLFFTFLNRPVIFVPFPMGAVSEKSEMWRFYSDAPRLNDVKELSLIINNLEHYPKELLKIYSSELVSHQGEANKRIKREIYGLLRLEQ